MPASFDPISRAIVCLLCSAIPLTALAEDWPAWRGPRGDGSSLEKNVPVRWNGAEGQNIVWKTPIPGKGHASPIVAGERIFLVSCREDTHDRSRCGNFAVRTLRCECALAVGSEALVSHEVIPRTAALDSTEAAPDSRGKRL